MGATGCRFISCDHFFAADGLQPVASPYMLWQFMAKGPTTNRSKSPQFCFKARHVLQMQTLRQVDVPIFFCKHDRGKNIHQWRLVHLESIFLRFLEHVNESISTGCMCCFYLFLFDSSLIQRYFAPVCSSRRNLNTKFVEEFPLIFDDCSEVRN